MKRISSLLALAACVVSTASMAGAQAAAGHTYVGAKACGMCHKSEKSGNQLGIWQNSKHAQAFTTLTTPAANDIAKAKAAPARRKSAP